MQSQKFLITIEQEQENVFEFTNNDIFGCYCNKNNLEILKNKEYANNAGIYFLISNETVKYVGLASTRKNMHGILNRIFEHNEEYWDSVIFFVGQSNKFQDGRDNSLYYLENKFINFFGVTNLENKTSGNEFVQDYMTMHFLDTIIEQIKFILNIFKIKSSNKRHSILTKIDNVSFAKNCNIKKGIPDWSKCISKYFYYSVAGFNAKIFCLGTNRWRLDAKTKLRNISEKASEKFKEMRKFGQINDNNEIIDEMIFKSAHDALIYINGQEVNALTALKDENGKILKEIIYG